MKKTTDIYSVRRQLLQVAAVVAMVLCPSVLAAQQTDSACSPRPLPWTTSFEEDNGYLSCWTTLADYNSYPMAYCYGFSHSGNCALAMLADAPANKCMVASPLLAHRADSLHVGFHLTMNDGYGLLLVGLVADTADTASFTPLLTLDLATAAVGYYEFYTDAYSAADTQAVAFLLRNGRVVVDDVEVEASTPCRRPWHPQVGPVTPTTIALAWEVSGVQAPAFVVRCIDTLTFDTLYFNTPNTSLIMSGLTPATAYRVDVAALCGGDTTSWMAVGVVTTDVACRQPLSASLGAATATAAVLCWEHDNGGYNAPSAMYLDLYDMTAAAPFGDALVVAGDNAMLSGLVTGHRYRATLQALCQSDTSAPLVVLFTPLAAPCSEGSSTVASNTLVDNGTTRYSYSQMLYPADVLAGADTLYAVALRVAENRLAFRRSLTVYVAQTADSVLATNIVAPAMTVAAAAFDLPPAVEGWVVIPFDHPFVADSTRGLVVSILDNTGNPTGQVAFGVHTEAYGGTLYTSSQSLAIDPTVFNMPLFSSRQVADMQLFGSCAMAACQPPAVVVSAVAEASVTLCWAGGTSPMVLRYAADGDDAWLTTAVTGTAHTLTGLNASTRYRLQVGNICGADTVFSSILEACTACGTAAVPYHADFTAAPHPCWQGQQHEAVGGVMLDGALVSPQFAVPLSSLQVRLALHPADDAAMVRVGVADADGNVVQWVDSVAPALIVGDEWVAMLDEYTGTASRIVVDGGDRCRLFSVGVEPLDACLPPRHVAVSAVGADRATLSWQGTAAGYTVYLRSLDGDEWSSWPSASNTITLTGLPPQTSFVGYAVSTCGTDGASSRPAWFRFATQCGAIAYFPYNQGFEADDATLGCWTVAYADDACAAANPVTTTSEYRCSGLRSLRFSSYSNVPSGIYDQYLISPRIVATDSIYLSFRCMKVNYDSEPFQVGFSVYGSATDDFLWMETVEPQAGTWTDYSIALPSAVRYVAIRYMGQGNYYLFIDDLVIDGPGCAAPHIAAVNEQTSSVSIGWDADADTAIVAITDGLWLSDAAGQAVVGNSHTFQGLEPGRCYTVGLRFRCPDGNVSDWTTRRVSTIDAACTPPAALVADAVGFDFADFSWAPTLEGQQWQLAVIDADGLVWQSGALAQPGCHVAMLEPHHAYSAIVRSLCSGIPGPWSDTLRFATPECLPVSALDYERVDFRTVIVSWELPQVSLGVCRVEYGPEGFVPGSGNVVDAASPCRLANLDPYADYDVYVRNYCAAGIVSDTVSYLNIPNGVGIAGCDDGRLTLAPNPASTSVSVGGLTPGADITIVDATGRVAARLTAADTTLVVDLSRYAPGAYFVRVVDTGGVAVGKLIVR